MKVISVIPFTMLVALALLFAACSAKTIDTARDAPVIPTEDVPPEPSAPVIPPVVDTQPGNTVKPESGTDKAFGTVDKPSALAIDDVTCDKVAKRITFRFKNTDTKTWQLNQQVPFPAPKDLAPLRVFINSYEANNPNGYIRDGVRYFGPQQKFSANCGGVETLNVGADVTCTLEPVPLKSSNEVAAGKNNIFVDTPTSHHVIEFLCS